MTDGDPDAAGVAGLYQLVAETRTAAAAGLHFLALFGALTLPDICGALASENGRASGSKYRAWVETHTPDLKHRAAELYGLRCSLLHQGQAHPHGSTFPLALALPSNITIHDARIVVGDHRVDLLDLRTVVDHLTYAVDKWLDEHGDSATVIRNMGKFARFRPDGLPPHIVGAPVIA